MKPRKTGPIIGAELCESPTLRSKHLDRLDALDRVAELATLPDGVHATTAQVAEFYGVPEKTITSVVVDHREELENNGYRVATGEVVNSLRESANLSPKVRSLALFTRQAILNVGMLLTESPIAAQVRQYLLTVEATATVEHKHAAVALIRLQERMDYKTVLDMLKDASADTDDYAIVQNLYYKRLFGKTAAQIKATQPQVTGKTSTRTGKLIKSTVAKDYFTADQLKLLNATVLATTSLAHIYLDENASVRDVMAVIEEALDVATRPKLRGMDSKLPAPRLQP